MEGRCTIQTATLLGVEAIPVEAQVDIGPGLPTFSIVGLPDLAVQEARERVRSAIRASGYSMPNARVVVNLAPGPLRKHGTGFDLPIALGILVATGQLPAAPFHDLLCVGELSLEGRLRAVPGLLAHAIAAKKATMGLLAPARGSAFLLDARVLPLGTLAELRTGLPEAGAREPETLHLVEQEVDFSDVCGQEVPLRALLLAAAGGHNALLIGPPGAGKTMLARRLPTILPELTDSERVETALIHSVAGLPDQSLLAGVRPFRAPHHTASTAGLIGGGSPPRPGEASLAHNGVLFLDEMSEFGPASLQCLRQPLEDGIVHLVRVEGRLRFPARFMLVGASNPCPCGHFGDIGKRCGCSPASIDRYRSRIGGPLLDRIDVIVRVDRPDPATLTTCLGGPCSSELARTVRRARARADERRCATALLGGQQLLKACAMQPGAVSFLERSARAHRLSGRGITRLLRLARTIADTADENHVTTEHLAEALGFRQGDAACESAIVSS